MAYGIKAAMLLTYDDLDKYREWSTDDEPCLFDISMPMDSFLTPKIEFETGLIYPELNDEVLNAVKAILSK